MVEDKQVLVSEMYLTELEKESRILGALYRGGVDNWDYYDDALEDLDDEA